MVGLKSSIEAVHASRRAPIADLPLRSRFVLFENVEALFEVMR